MSSFRHIVGAVLRRAAKRFDRVIVHTSQFPVWIDPAYSYRVITSVRPDVVLDVGANEGQFARGLRSCGYLGRLVSFEPQPGPFAVLSQAASGDPAWECHQYALGEQTGRLTMHLSAFSPSSSLLPIGREHVTLFPHTTEVGSVDVDVVRLDDLAKHLGLGCKSVFLKLDVQGYESQVLAGGQQVLREAVGVIAELNFAPLFEGQSRYYDVMATIEASGLRFVALTGIYLHPDTMDCLWGDALFLRRC